MSANSPIEWTDHTFNSWRGCTKVSPGCAHCYAETLSFRNPKVLGRWGKGKPRVLASDAMWREPLKWEAAASSFRQCTRCGLREQGHEACGVCGCDTIPARQRVFCASLADWLDDEVPIEWLARLLALIHATPNLDWLLLTKRPENWQQRTDQIFSLKDKSTEADMLFGEWLVDWVEGRPPLNVWIGTTVEDQTRAMERIPKLLSIPARVRFLSCEPLLSALDLPEAIRKSLFYKKDGTNNAWSLPGHPMINWVICGGESGPKARAMHPDWARGVRDQCAAAGAPFLFKQWGEWAPRTNHPEISTDDILAMPLDDFKVAWRDATADEKEAYIADKAASVPVGELPDGSELSVRGLDMLRLGKKKAGRLLDGIEYNGFPA